MSQPDNLRYGVEELADIRKQLGGVQKRGPGRPRKPRPEYRSDIDVARDDRRVIAVAQAWLDGTPHPGWSGRWASDGGGEATGVVVNETNPAIAPADRLHGYVPFDHLRRVP